MTQHTKSSPPPQVAAVFSSYPESARKKLLVLRTIIFETAAAIEAVGELEETLKWGEPSYLTPKTKSGSTVRLAWNASRPDEYAVYFKCTADLVPAFKERYPDTFKYAGDRAIVFQLDDHVPHTELKACIALALTYHRNKKLDRESRWQIAAVQPTL